ncbi:hypothetical protein OAR97_01010 [Arcobacteraceae bacterium]|nr:hypothetical protein [Arcobacteraceae bacterium]
MSFMDRLIKKVEQIAPRLKKRTFDPEAMSIEDISLPNSLMNLDVEDIKNMIEKEVATFKSLDYKNKTLEQLKINEFHSYEIGFMLRYIKEDRVFLIANIDEIIPSFIMGSTRNQLHIKVFDIVYRYDLGVNKMMSVDQLEKEIKWSPREAAYLLRYLNMEDRTITGK